MESYKELENEQLITTPDAESEISPNPDLDKTSYDRREFLISGARALAAFALLSGAPQLFTGCSETAEQPQKTVPKIEEKEHPEIDRNKMKLTGGFGTVYVWHPAYKGDIKNVVIHFHGYNADPTMIKKILSWRPWKHKKGSTPWKIDEFWKNGRLEEQFRLSGMKNTLFVVPESSRGNKGDRMQKDPRGLLEFVQKETGINTNKDLIVMAHSGGEFTVPYWIEDPRVNWIVLLDALYGDAVPNQFHKWLAESEANRAILVATSTSAGSLARHREFAGKYCPIEFTGKSKIRRSVDCKKVMYMEAPEDHSALVYSQNVIPKVLSYIQSQL